MGEALLTVRALRKRFGAVEALTGVDLDLPAGEVVALVGDNGAGKSTLVKALAGTHTPDSGAIQLDGKAVRITCPSDAQGLGITTVFQDLALCENLDVVANLYLGRELRRSSVLSHIPMERAARSLLASLDVRIKDIHAPVSALSGGQRQSVAITRALVAEPRVVLLDEPTAALGVEQTAKVLDLVRKLRDRGLAVMVISHNLADVFQVSDRISVLRLGRNAGTFKTASASHEDVVAAITGATGNGGHA
jgi:D-xylose transport system ATP-binding protein